MTEASELCQKLQSVWDADFPMVSAMGVRAAHFDNHTLTTHTPLAGNTNIHGTAFAGSLYAIEALTAWGLLFLELELAGLAGSIIHATGNIEFDRPIEGDIVVTSNFLAHPDAMAELAARGKIKLTMTSEAYADGEVAGRFSGAFGIRLERP